METIQSKKYKTKASTLQKMDLRINTKNALQEKKTNTYSLNVQQTEN